MDLSCALPNMAATAALAKALRAQLRADDILLLSGDMGSGKTSFVRALVEELRASPNENSDVSSPTYALHHRYIKLVLPFSKMDHWDLYRVKDESELDAAGFWELMESESSLLVIEWPQIVPASAWPIKRRRWSLCFTVSFTVSEAGDRRVNVELL